jgi:hypothetical protein
MKLLGSNQIIFDVKNGEITIRPVEMSLEEAFGSIKPTKEIKNKTEAELEEILAEETAQRQLAK